MSGFIAADFVIPQFIAQPDAAQMALMLIVMAFAGGAIDYVCSAWKEHSVSRLPKPAKDDSRSRAIAA